SITPCSSGSSRSEPVVGTAVDIAHCGKDGTTPANTACAGGARGGADGGSDRARRADRYRLRVLLRPDLVAAVRPGGHELLHAATGRLVRVGHGPVGAFRRREDRPR